MESVAAWAGVEPYGLESSRSGGYRSGPSGIWVGNAANWEPSRRFDVIRTGLDYVPRDRRRDLIAHLLRFCERLVVGVHNEECDTPGLEEGVASWGFEIAGRSVRNHPHPQLVYKAFWIDAK